MRNLAYDLMRKFDVRSDVQSGVWSDARSDAQFDARFGARSDVQPYLSTNKKQDKGITKKQGIA